MVDETYNLWELINFDWLQIEVDYKEVWNMAVPKRKTSKARRDKRKSANMKMTAPGISICPQCHEPKLPHRVCPNCNYYDGKEVVEA